MVDANASTLVRQAATSSRPVGPRVPRAVGFAAISASLLAFFVAAGAPTPLLPLYEKDWGFAPSLLTVAFGVYAFGLIAALVVAGGLSDYIGRRPVLITALALELAAMVVFLFSSSIGWIIAARVLQGIATGLASSTFGAAIVELASERRKKLGALMTSLMTTAGLGLGALFAGLVALAIPTDAAVTVWIVLTVIMATGTAFAALTPETSTRRPGALASLAPRVTVPTQMKRLFAATAPTIATGFLVTGFFLGLVPIVLAGAFGVTQPIVGGLINFIMFTSATASAGLTGSIPPHRVKLFGNIAMLIGSVLVISAIATHDVTLVWISAAIGGAGMGAGFSGSLRGLIAEVSPHERAGLLAAVFTLAYLVFGGTAIIAGMLVSVIGVTAMGVGFAVLIVVLAISGIVATAGVLARGRRVTTATTRTVMVAD